MLRLSKLCYLSLFGSIIILLLQSITSLTSTDLAWKKLRFVDILDAHYYSWVDNITLLNINAISNYILNMPLYAFLFCLTIVFFILSGIIERE